MKRLFVLVLCLINSSVFAAVMNVNTEYGYIKDSEGKIVCKYDLPKGQHPLKDGYTYVETSKDDFNKVEVYQEPVKELTTQEKLDKLGITKQELKDYLK